MPGDIHTVVLPGVTQAMQCFNCLMALLGDLCASGNDRKGAPLDDLNEPSESLLSPSVLSAATSIPLLGAFKAIILTTSRAVNWYVIGKQLIHADSDSQGEPNQFLTIGMLLSHFLCFLFLRTEKTRRSRCPPVIVALSQIGALLELSPYPLCPTCPKKPQQAAIAVELAERSLWVWGLRVLPLLRQTLLVWGKIDSQAVKSCSVGEVRSMDVEGVEKCIEAGVRVNDPINPTGQTVLDLYVIEHAAMIEHALQVTGKVAPSLSLPSTMLKEEDADKETCVEEEENRSSGKGIVQFSRCQSDPAFEDAFDTANARRTPSLPRIPKDGPSHFTRQITAPAVMQVADYYLRSEMMTVLYEGSNTLITNSKVRRSSAFREPSCGVGDDLSPKSLEVDVAVKSVALNEDDCDLAMMRRECEILNRLGHSHPHIMPALGFAECESEMVLLMRFASEGDLNRLAPSGACFEEIQAKRLGHQMMSALAFLEEHRIGRLLAQLTDFGLAQELPEGQTFIKLNEVPGSYGYIASEVKHRKQISFAADLFALGVILFRLLGSYDPFHPASDVDSELIFDEECWEPLSQLSQEFVTRLLNPNPALRGLATQMVKGDLWFCTDESQLVGKPRTGFAPTPVKKLGWNVDFHTLEDSRSVWKVLQPVR
eukprot:s298_g23.t2